MHSRDTTVLIDLILCTTPQSTFSVHVFLETIIYYDCDYDWNTALLLLVNPSIPHQTNGTARPIIVWKEDILLPAMLNPL